jgi:S-phase kinase-associated protein 1
MAEQTENTNNPIAEESKKEPTMEVIQPPDGLMVKLVSKDGHEFEITAQLAVQSKMIATGLEGRSETDEDTPEMTLPQVEGRTLTKVIEFFNLHATKPLGEIPQPLRTKNLADAVSKEYVDFIKLEQESLFELVLAANYMDIPPLLELGCAAIAIQLKGMKTCKEMADHFGLKREYKEPTVDDIERLRKKYPWMDKQAPI